MEATIDNNLIVFVFTIISVIFVCLLDPSTPTRSLLPQRLVVSAVHFRQAEDYPRPLQRAVIHTEIVCISYFEKTGFWVGRLVSCKQPFLYIRSKCDMAVSAFLVSGTTMATCSARATTTRTAAVCFLVHTYR